jgi:hypothetical protein
MMTFLFVLVCSGLQASTPLAGRHAHAKRIRSKPAAIAVGIWAIELMSPDGDSGFGNRGLINRG